MLVCQKTRWKTIYKYPNKQNPLMTESALAARETARKTNNITNVLLKINCLQNHQTNLNTISHIRRELNRIQLAYSAIKIIQIQQKTPYILRKKENLNHKKEIVSTVNEKKTKSILSPFLVSNVLRQKFNGSFFSLYLSNWWDRKNLGKNGFSKNKKVKKIFSSKILKDLCIPVFV